MNDNPNIACLIEALTRDARFAAAILFGSIAKGTERPDSDVDVAALYTDEEARASIDANLLTVMGDFGLIAHRNVHLIDLARVDSALQRSIWSTGRLLFDRSGRILRDLKVASLLDYFDWEYARRVIDEGHRRRLEPTHG